MRKQLLIVLVLILAVSVSYGQKVINGFDAAPDTSYWDIFMGDNAIADSSYLEYSFVANPVVAGDSAMKVVYSAQNSESWGGFVKLEHWKADSNSTYDFTGYDSISFMYYNELPASAAGRVHLRLNLHDVSNSADGNKTYDVAQCEYYYSFHYIMDNEPGWQEIKLPILSNDSWDGNGFNLTGWSGITGNADLDLHKIKGFSLEVSINGGGSGERVYGEFIIDDFKLTGAVAAPFIIFTGNDLTPKLAQFTWGQSTLEIEEGTGTDGSNVLKWVQGNEWANGWTGAGFNIDPPQDMTMSWGVDSLKFAMKASAGTDTILFQFEDGAAKKACKIDPIDDGEWHEYALKLTDFFYNEGTSNFDSTNVSVFQFMAFGNAVVGNTIEFDYLWTGNPIIDITGTDEVQGVDAVQSTEYYNLVIWQDNEGESEETYNVYACTEPITDVTAPNVETVAVGVYEGTQNAIHYLYYPLVEGQVTYYYAVVCIDNFGNDGPAGLSGAVTNTAKGIPTISLDVPANFAVDGDLGEWYDSDIMPWVLTPETDNVATGTVTDAADLSATVYLAIDDDNLYVAAEVTDDVYNFGEGEWWNQDAFEFFIGLFDSRGAKHTSNKRGAEPDYKLQMHANGLVNEYIGKTIWTVDDPLFHLQDFGGADYVIETQIPLDSIAGDDDVRFHPLRGMRIPIELYFHDNDGAWDGNLAWSPFNTDLAWSSPTQWSYTWIGDTTDVAATGISDGSRNVLKSYRLEQNFPNPFNPVTQIQYTIPHAGNVSIQVFNMLGQKVADLVDKYQASGVYQVSWNATDVPSGVYFYQIQSGVFNQTKKMLLVK
ncbi:MAG: T9SS type A sorting domain-containing protein [Candidatus Marinimicrobia bacterium]|nr:T9SS type A sorting domain-containing protein [Candidatus Neomarinimicrobiota bacterium]